MNVCKIQEPISVNSRMIKWNLALPFKQYRLPVVVKGVKSNPADRTLCTSQICQICQMSCTGVPEAHVQSCDSVNIGVYCPS